ncbi:MAG: N-acetylmuramoyl-L-alanine amidase [Puniceicoccales bacterium]|jgi:N-acetylmuramoyl-L-alanine amidase|nr:N-acetylmuramoyl-L-alanine amidase [Puniceicoccales bacterium]
MLLKQWRFLAIFACIINWGGLNSYVLNAGRRLTNKYSSYRDVYKTEDIENVLKCYNFRCVYEDGKYFRCFNCTHHIAFIVESKEMIFDGTKLFLTRPVVKNPRQNRFFVAAVDVEKILKPLLEPEKIKKYLPNGGCIVIDAGHGGMAEGAKNSRLNLVEKRLTLNTARALQTALSKLGYRVFLTRDSDVDLSLERRGQWANKLKAQLFVSLHYNAAESVQARGIETFTYTFASHPSTDRTKALVSDGSTEINNRFDVQNTYLAYCIQKSVTIRLGSIDRGVRRARFGVLRHIHCPAVLIECGFLSNDDEAKRIATSIYQEKLVSSIVEGIQRYVHNTIMRTAVVQSTQVLKNFQNKKLSLPKRPLLKSQGKPNKQALLNAYP